MKRDSTWVLREYGEEKWPSVLAEIERFSGSPDQLLHLVSGPDPLRVREILLGGSLLTVPDTLAVNAYRGWIASSVAHYARSSDLVVELGTGWGRNLAMSRLHGANPDARYIAGEFTPAGRNACTAAAERIPGIDLTSVEFDFHNPRLDMIKPAAKATVFTNHSIEQIPYVKAELLDVVNSIAREVTVLHFEPIGWQIRNDPHSDYAEAHDYNRNLWSLLTESRVEIHDVAEDVIGINPANPTSKVVWSLKD